MLFLFQSNLENLNLNETFQNANNIILYILMGVFGIGLVSLLIKGFNLIHFISYIICSAIAIYLLLNPDKLELIGEECFNLFMSVLKTIPSFSDVGGVKV